jgi:hypothetical protein
MVFNPAHLQEWAFLLAKPDDTSGVFASGKSFSVFL